MRIFFTGKFFFLLFVTALPLACKQDSLPANKNVKTLHALFHGKYELLMVRASAPVDANLDGISSYDLSNELPDMQNAKLEIRIINSGFFWSQFWPQPFFSQGIIPSAYDPSFKPNFAMQSALRYIEFNEDLTQIFQLPDHISIDTFRFPRADSILIEIEEQIEVRWHQSFYTPAGWQNVEVVALYKRYTMAT